MTDEALSGGAVAPADTNVVPVDGEHVSTPQPLGSQTPVATKEEPENKPSQSVGEAVRKANAEIKAKAAAKEAETAKEPAKETPKAEIKAEPKADTAKITSKEPQQPAQKPQEAQEPPKAEDEAPKQPSGFRDAPKRFSDDAKTAWEAAPEPVKAEIHRAVKELETGINHYRDAFEPLKPYYEMARQHGTTVQQAMENYTNLERTLLSDPVRGLQMVADYAGINLRDFAARLLNQSPDEVASQNESTIRELRSEISGLKQQLGGVTSTIQEQRVAQVQANVDAFAASHPRFDELADAIAGELKHGYDLEAAYKRAELLNPAPAAASAPAPVTPAPQPPLNPAGSKSISGAPSAGSDPVSSKAAKSSTIREALKRAAAQAG